MTNAKDSDMGLTLEERERRAYIEGNLELAAALGAALDRVSDAADEAEHDARMARQEVTDLEEEVDRLETALSELTSERDVLRAQVDSLCSP